MQLQIGAHTFKITLEPRPNSDTQWVYGYCDQTNNQIMLDAATSDSRQFEILWHEVLHCLFYQLGLKDHDEGLISGLAEQITSALCNNKSLRSIPKYLKERPK